MERQAGRIPASLERRAARWAGAYFFFLLCSYYVLRPVRDAMGISAGVESLQWAFTGTFLAMLAAVPLYGAAVARLPRRRLLPAVYGFFVANLLIFGVLLQARIGPAAVARAFFIWLSVFNLFVVSVFWSFMADLFSNAQARRLFGFIAAGGTAGALLGPGLTALFAGALGVAWLLFIAAGLLTAAMACMGVLLRAAAPPPLPRAAPETGTAGGLWAGLGELLRSPYLLGIAAYVWLYTTVGTFLYFEQAHIVASAVSGAAAQTRLFALVDLGVNLLALAGQLLLTHRVIAGWGLPGTLAAIPSGLLLGFAALAAAPALPVLLAVQVLRRAGNYALAKPAREVLFTVVSREERYKAKSVIDTLVYRGGDALSAWLFAGLAGLGFGLTAMALLALPLTGLWLASGLWIGRRQERLRAAAARQ